MMSRRLLAGTGVLAALLLVGTVQAAPITYVDANLAAGGNTVDATTGLPHPFSASADGNDNLWRQRTDAGPPPFNGGNAYESNGNGAVVIPQNAEDVPRLVTTISGLAPGTYNVYAYFIGNNDNMRMGASLTNPGAGTQLPIYTVGAGAAPAGDFVGTQVTDAALANFTNSPSNDNVFGTDRWYQASLGTATAVGGQIQVYIDNDISAAVQAARIATPTANGNLWRTVYDGVGYEPVVIPEPTSLCLVAVSVLGFVARRRRT